ncbi:MAG: hypothetical protein WCO00_08490 [Rhodospirillaceae bacterium]
MDNDVYFVGITRQTETGGLGRLRTPVVVPAWQVYPTRRQLADFAAPLLAILAEDDQVVEITSGAVLGRYGVSQELSVGLEIVAGPHFAVEQVAATVFRLARDAVQQDAFIARVLPPDEWADNTRPGLTLTFRTPQRIGALQRLRDRINGFAGDGWPIDGFTTIPATGESVGLVSGLRYIFLPEISIRWDLALRRQLTGTEDAMDIILLDQSAKIGRLTRALEDEPMIERAWLNWFDVIVGGLEDYDDLIARLQAAEPASGDETSMSRKQFSELLGLTNQSVLTQRLKAVEVVPPAAFAVAG